MRKSAFLIALMASLLAACGSGDSNSFKGTGAATGPGGGTGQAVQLGTGTGSGFQAGAIGIISTSLSAGGSTSLTVSLQQADGNLYTTSSTVTFNSPCVAQGSAKINPASDAMTATGIATVTYVANGCTGPDVITATAVLNGVTSTATGTVTVAQGAIGTIAFVSATPTNIALKGTGDPGRPEASTVVFKVLDSSGGPRAGAMVAFTLDTSVGGISLTPASLLSDAQGLVQTVVNAGTVSTSIRVTASITSVTPNISTQSSQLTVTTGIPTAASFSLALACQNVEGLDLDGTTTAVTARLADRFGNPVPDGTAVTFTAEGGAVQAQCTTVTTTTESGLCAVTWRSSNPRPTDGRVTLLATAIGEESFVDSNGNGAFDNGETFTDLPEPYRDDNEDGVYTPGTDGYFFDFNNDGVRDPADGKFNGVLCNDTTGRCGGPSSRSTGIGAKNVVVMSGSTPVVTDTAGAALAPISMPINGSQSVTVWVRDVNNNIMPGGTVVSAAVSGSAVQLGTPNTFGVPCSNVPAGTKGSGTVFSFSLTAGSTAGSGIFNLTVKTPSGQQTLVQIPVTVS